MPKTLTATELRANLYRVIDEVIATGKPCVVVRNGDTVTIARRAPRRKRLDLSKLKRRNGLYKGTFDELVATSWESEWKPYL